MTREERNVLLFVALGVVMGSWPAGSPRGEQAAPDDPAEADLPGEVAAGSPDSAAAVPAGPDRRDAETEDAEPVDLFPIDLNGAPAALLEELPGIGPAKARAIVELRGRKGVFRSADELAEVRGIGPRTVERLRGLVTVGRTDGGREREGSHLGERATGDPAPRERGPEPGSARAGEEAAEVER